MIGYSDAVDEIFGLFKTAWETNSSGIVGYVPERRTQGVEENEIPLEKYWCRLSQETVFEEQSSLRNGDCGQTYTNEGLVFVQLFCPKSDAQSMEMGRKLSEVARNAFRGKTTAGQVWFRNARIKELEPETEWYRFNIIAEYKYEDNS